MPKKRESILSKFKKFVKKAEEELLLLDEFLILYSMTEQELKAHCDKESKLRKEIILFFYKQKIFAITDLASEREYDAEIMTRHKRDMENKVREYQEQASIEDSVVPEEDYILGD